MSINTRAWRKIREQVFNEYGRACAYCGYEDEVMTVDHIIPRIRGGQDILENLLPACRRCNYSKGSKMSTDPSNGANRGIGGLFGSDRTPPTLHGLFIPQNDSISHDKGAFSHS